MESTTQFDDLYTQLKNFFNKTTSGELSLEIIPSLTSVGMEILQKSVLFKSLNGNEKKELLVRVIKMLVLDLNKDEKINNDILNSILSIVPLLIDTTVNFAKIYVPTKTKCC